MASAPTTRTRTTSPSSSGTSRGSGSLDGFADFCSKLTLEDGSPFDLYAEQREMLADYFGGVTETLILVPKKNGKTTLLAALALHHLMVTPDAECVIAAASRDQAQILLNQARGFVRRSTLGRYMTVKQREIVSLRDEGRVRVLASDSDTADGVIPTLAFVDELHRHKDNGAMYGVFHDGLGPRNGQIITISTAGEDEDSTLGELRSSAYALPGMKRDGAHRYARSEDFAMHEWALDPTDDRSDMEIVAAANPAPWQTPQALGRRFTSPSMRPERWARFACGVWVRSEDSWVTGEAVENCRGEPCIPSGAEAVCGVDIGLKKDSTALAVVAMVDGKVHVRHKITIPAPGHPIAVADARAQVGKFADEYDLLEVPYDPYKFGESAEMLEEQGLVMVEFPQTDGRMAKASEALYELINDGRLVHDGDPEFVAQLLAVVPMETERGVRISKRKSKKRIDIAVALAMAVDRLLANQLADGPMFEVIS